MKLIPLDAVLAIIKENVKSLFENNDRIYDEYGNYFYKNAENDYRFYHKLDDFEWDEDKLSLSDVAEYLFPINYLEVQEVDLDKEIKNYNMEYVDNNGFFDTEHFAKHFFELGINTSNQLTWEDVKEICVQSVLVEIDLGGKVSDERHYTEVLKRFKAQKGEKV